MKPLLGIDFGTSSARAALATGRDVKMVSHAGQALAIPSVVAFPPAASGGGPPLVGALASTVQARHPERTITAVKRLLGRKLEAPEVRHHRQTVAYDLVGARNGDARVRVGRRHHAPQDIAAYILGALRSAAERQAGETVTDAVLAVPAMFDDLQRQAVRDAARIAGLDVKGLLSEPSAAAVGSDLYPAPRGEERKVIIYHLGGGSFDVAALVVGDEQAEVVASSGDAFLGGEDFDQRIVTAICEEAFKTDGGDSRRDRSLLARLKDVAERAKIELSRAKAVDIHLPQLGIPAPAAVRLDRARLETITQDLVDRTVWSCEAVLRESKWSTDDVELVLLMGEQTRMPRIRAQIGELFGKAPVEAADPELFVALGAARHALALSGGSRRGRARGSGAVIELTSLSLGLESAGGVFSRLIPRGSPLPATRSQMLSTALDGQTHIVLHLLQGEREMAADNVSVARVQISGLPSRPRGGIQIEVAISTDGSGLPTVVARDNATGEDKPVRLRPSAGLGEAEIAALVAVHAGVAAPAAAVTSAADGQHGQHGQLDEGGDDGADGDVDAPEGERESRSNLVVTPTVQGG